MRLLSSVQGTTEGHPDSNKSRSFMRRRLSSPEFHSCTPPSSPRSEFCLPISAGEATTTVYQQQPQQREHEQLQQIKTTLADAQSPSSYIPSRRTLSSLESPAVSPTVAPANAQELAATSTSFIPWTAGAERSGFSTTQFHSTAADAPGAITAPPTSSTIFHSPRSSLTIITQTPSTSLWEQVLPRPLTVDSAFSSSALASAFYPAAPGNSRLRARLTRADATVPATATTAAPEDSSCSSEYCPFPVRSIPAEETPCSSSGHNNSRDRQNEKRIVLDRSNRHSRSRDRELQTECSISREAFEADSPVDSKSLSALLALAPPPVLPAFTTPASDAYFRRHRKCFSTTDAEVTQGALLSKESTERPSATTLPDASNSSTRFAGQAGASHEQQQKQERKDGDDKIDKIPPNSPDNPVSSASSANQQPATKSAADDSEGKLLLSDNSCRRVAALLYAYPASLGISLSEASAHRLKHEQQQPATKQQAQQQRSGHVTNFSGQEQKLHAKPFEGFHREVFGTPHTPAHSVRTPKAEMAAAAAATGSADEPYVFSFATSGAAGHDIYGDVAEPAAPADAQYVSSLNDNTAAVTAVNCDDATVPLLSGSEHLFAEGSSSHSSSSAYEEKILHKKGGGGTVRGIILVLAGVCIGLGLWPMLVSYFTFRLLHTFHDFSEGKTDFHNDGFDVDSGADDHIPPPHISHPGTGNEGVANENNARDGQQQMLPSAAPPPAFTPLTFADLAGLTEAKIELQEIVEFLKEPLKFERLGARLPKGVLLVGPPGTGKTALARAVATEANVPYIYASGSEFVEIYVGQGARRVRSLFAYARLHAPCIIFLDELDAVGSKRAAAAAAPAGGSNNREHDQTLNQLLVEMDGFNNKESSIVVLAATNRVDTLDPALLRPGRFDRIVHVPLPDVAARELILLKYLKRVAVVPQAAATTTEQQQRKTNKEEDYWLAEEAAEDGESQQQQKKQEKKRMEKSQRTTADSKELKNSTTSSSSTQHEGGGAAEQEPVLPLLEQKNSVKSRKKDELLLKKGATPSRHTKEPPQQEEGCQQQQQQQSRDSGAAQLPAANRNDGNGGVDHDDGGRESGGGGGGGQHSPKPSSRQGKKVPFLRQRRPDSADSSGSPSSSAENSKKRGAAAEDATEKQLRRTTRQSGSVDSREPQKKTALPPAAAAEGLRRGLSDQSPSSVEGETGLRAEKKGGEVTELHRQLAKKLAKLTPGFSGAELENLVNEAAILAARNNKEVVSLEDLQEARDKVTMGPARKSRVMSAWQKQLTAYHEAGHAIIAFYLQPYADPIHQATIISRGSALGFVEQLPLEDRYGQAVAQLEARLCVCMGGRVAERLVFGDEFLSNGASSDIEIATKIAFSMVTEWGMSEKLGPLSYQVNGRNKRAFISSQTASAVEEEVKEFVTRAEKKAEQLLRRHRGELRKVAELLLEKETLSGEEISALLDPSKKFRTKVEKLRNQMQRAGLRPSLLQRLFVFAARAVSGVHTALSHVLTSRSLPQIPPEKDDQNHQRPKQDQKSPPSPPPQLPPPQALSQRAHHQQQSPAFTQQKKEEKEQQQAQHQRGAQDNKGPD